MVSQGRLFSENDVEIEDIRWINQQKINKAQSKATDLQNKAFEELVTRIEALNLRIENIEKDIAKLKVSKIR